MKSNYSNTAPLKDLMTVPPMTAAQHAEVMRKRIAQRHMVEEARGSEEVGERVRAALTGSINWL